MKKEERFGYILGCVLIRWVAQPFILMGLWNTIAYEFNLPTFNFIFFLGCVTAIHIFKFNPKANA